MVDARVDLMAATKAASLAALKAFPLVLKMLGYSSAAMLEEMSAAWKGFPMAVTMVACWAKTKVASLERPSAASMVEWKVARKAGMWAAK